MQRTHQNQSDSAPRTRSIPEKLACDKSAQTVPAHLRQIWPYVWLGSSGCTRQLYVSVSNILSGRMNVNKLDRFVRLVGLGGGAKEFFGEGGWPFPRLFGPC